MLKILLTNSYQEIQKQDFISPETEVRKFSFPHKWEQTFLPVLFVQTVKMSSIVFRLYLGFSHFSNSK